MKPRHFFCCLVLLAGVFAAGTGSAQSNREYFVRQEADEALLIRINTFEAEFETRVFGANGELLLASSLADSRIAPVFQYIDAPSTPRQLNIVVTSGRATNRSRFGLELTRLTVWDDRSATVARAYQLLSFGLQATSIDNAANWSVRINSLMDAARIFNQYGMKEMRLWSSYLAAHLVYFRLHDHNIVIGMSRELLAELKTSRLREIELATLQLQSAALISARRAGTLNISASNPDPIQTVLMQAANLAASLDLQLELANAINVSGTEFADRGLYSKALVQFQLAVKIADSLGDGELATRIRESIVQIHARRGDAPASSEVLQQIETQLAEDGGGDELALNQLQQGRLLMRSYQYPQAIAILSQALNNQNDSAIGQQIHFELAKSRYQSGRLDASMSHLLAAQVSPKSSQYLRPNPLVDLGEALGIMANIHRQRGEYEQMRQVRGAQGQSVKADAGRAGYLYQQGLDELTGAARNRQQALSLFQKSRQAAASSGLSGVENLALLQICALARQGDSDRALCSNARVRTTYESLLSSAIPRHTLEAMYLRARFLQNTGQRSEAGNIMDRLVDEIHLFRHSLPGVLGAWYWERHEQLFAFYLGLKIAASTARDRGGVDGMDSLLALSKIRFIENSGQHGSATNPGGEHDESLRADLAQRVHPQAGQIPAELESRIKKGLDSLRLSFRDDFGFLSRAGLTRHLESLLDDEAVLTWHITPAVAYLWIGRHGRVRQQEIAYADELYRLLQSAKSNLQIIEGRSIDVKMDTLGKRLLAPVADLLPETIHWIPAGPMLGFPLDAVRLDGRYLIERHQVINMLSFPAGPNPASTLQAGPWQRIFLAGYPQDFSGNYASRLDTSAQIQSVADFFVGPGLRIVQGGALLPDEFQDERFGQAELVHLTMPGVISLEHPERSSLQLSEPDRGRGRAPFRPEDIRPGKLESSLVFLSATRVEGSARSAFHSQIAIVSGFLAADATAVIASLWEPGEEAAETLITGFYRNMSSSRDISAALTGSKRSYLQYTREKGYYDWAGLQLFVE